MKVFGNKELRRMIGCKRYEIREWKTCVAKSVEVTYGYEHQHNNKVEYLRLKTKTDADIYLVYLI